MEVMQKVNNFSDPSTTYMYNVIGPGHAKTCLKPYANNKDADQPAHPHPDFWGHIIFLAPLLSHFIFLLHIKNQNIFLDKNPGHPHLPPPQITKWSVP